jgi:hypothetical protein
MTNIGDRSRTHGESNRNKTKEYRTWLHMRGRCNTPTDLKFKDYGGRGITVCERWNSYENFLSDMGRAPSPKHSLDRKENSGNYEPVNCRWATTIEQTNNTRRNNVISYNNKTMNLSQWCRELSLYEKTIWYRLKRGWGVEKAFTTPCPPRNP